MVYSIHTFHETYQDGGLFGIYAGTGPEELEELVPLALDQIQLIKSGVNEQELTRAKTQITSSVRMGREKMMTRADQQGRYVLGHDESFNVHSFVEKINAVTTQDVINVAKDIFSTKILVSAVGPIEKLMPNEEIEERLA